MRDRNPMNGLSAMRGRVHAPKRIVKLLVSSALILTLIPSCKKKEATVHEAASSADVGSTAPIFTLRDLGGNNVSLSDFKGEIVVMDFWATWCKWCKETTRELEKIHKDYETKGVVIVGISMDQGGDAGQKVREFARKHNLSYLMLMDDGSTSRTYRVNKIPTTFILNKDHVIRQIYPGYLPGLRESIVEEIEKSLANSQVPRRF